MSLSFWVTADVSKSAAIMALDTAFKLVLYYFHERVWYTWIGFGITEVVTLRKAVDSQS